MREGLTIIIALLILAVVLDGLRRMRQARRGAIRMSARMPASNERSAEGAGYGSELPNGGARVVNVRKPDDAQQLYQKIRQTQEEKKRRLGRTNRIPQQVALNLDEHVPTLMEVEQDSDAAQTTAPSSAPGRADTVTPVRTASSKANTSARETVRETVAAPRPTERIEPSFDESAALADETADDWDADDNWTPQAEASLDSSRDTVEEASAFDEVDEDVDLLDDAEGDEEYREPELVLVINVMAPKGERFRGDILLETVLEQGMRFGSMNIFHHHASQQGKGPVLYSMANIVVPGTFDLNTMKDDFTTPGVSLFLALPIDADSSKAFETMLGTARAIAAALGGELKDENRSVMTTQTIEHYRSRIKEYERKQLSRHV